jgi:hypothetical protein
MRSLRKAAVRSGGNPMGVSQLRRMVSVLLKEMFSSSRKAWEVGSESHHREIFAWL